MRMGPGQRLRGRPVHHPARPREMRAGAGEERVIVGPRDACPSTCPHRDWDSHCGGQRSARVGVEPAAGAECFPYLQALVGRVRPGARAAVLGSAVAGARSLAVTSPAGL